MEILSKLLHIHKWQYSTNSPHRRCINCKIVQSLMRDGSWDETS